jgi:hypothetical protein
VRACLIVSRIGGKNSLQARLAEDQNLVEALATQCANQMLRSADPGEIGRSRMPTVLTRDVKPDSPFLKDEVLKGIGFSGTAYNTGRRHQLAYLIAITKAFNIESTQ